MTQTKMQNSKDFAKLSDNLIIGHCKITGAMFSEEESEAGGRRERLRNLLLLACAWSANIGATGVIIGQEQTLTLCHLSWGDIIIRHPGQPCCSGHPRC